MFDLERFLADLKAARERDETHKEAAAVMREAFAEPEAISAHFGPPSGGCVNKLHHSEDLTVLQVIWPAGFHTPVHNHRMWAIIGIYDGREDNIFWRRTEEGRVEAAGAKTLSLGDVAPLGPDVIHSVLNPLDRLTSAIHVYGGDFFADGRSEWDPEDLREGPMDVGRTVRRFAQFNAEALAAD